MTFSALLYVPVFDNRRRIEQALEEIDLTTKSCSMNLYWYIYWTCNAPTVSRLLALVSNCKSFGS